MTTQLEEFTQFIADFSREALKKSGYLPPMFIIHREGELYFFNPDMEDDEAKSQSAFMMRLLVNYLNADMVVFATEAWMRTEITKKGETLDQAMKRQTKRVSESPDRMEVLMINGESQTQACNNIYEIKRDNKEVITGFEKQPFISKSGNYEGRFAEFFKPLDDKITKSFKDWAKNTTSKIKSNIRWH